jgi:type VI secretion system secreted protein Hcp
MASDIFAKIGDIKGESVDDKHKDEIDVLSFSWGVTNAGSMAFGSGGGVGKAQFSDFSFTTTTSKASPSLFLACASGQHIKDATITVRRAGDGRGSQQDYLVIKMNDVLVSSYNTGGSSGGDRPTESVSMAFAKVELSYSPQKPDGTLDAPITAGWDLKANKKV